LRSQSPLLRLKGIEKYISLSAISIMMLGVLVLLGQKQEGSCCEVMLGCFGFSVAMGFCGCFFSCFSCLFCLFVLVCSLYAQDCLHLL